MVEENEKEKNEKKTFSFCSKEILTDSHMNQSEKINIVITQDLETKADKPVKVALNFID